MSGKPPREKSAHEELMDRSLTNVRALVDKELAEEAAEKEMHRRILVGLGVVTAIALAVIVFVVAK